MRSDSINGIVVHTHDYIASEGGVDLPPFHGRFRPIGDLADLPLARGTSRVKVEVTLSGLSSPLDKPASIAIFVDDDLKTVGDLAAGETLTLPWTTVEDTRLVTIMWRSARDVTNRLEEDGRARVIISMDIGTRLRDHVTDATS